MGENLHNIPVFIIFGPTASGKTFLAEHLFAKHANTVLAGNVEIVSADSMQVYKYLDIGTAKPEKSLLELLPHHLIDIFSPHKQFTAGDFVRLADEAIADIYSRGKFPVIMGGTAFYIKNFLYGLPETPSADESVRNNLKLRMNKEGAQVLWNELNILDAVSASRIHINDEYRILRALEVCVDSNRPLSSFKIPDTLRLGYTVKIIGIERPREELYQRIDLRVIQMFEQGLAQEFFSLIDKGYTSEDPGMQAIGYREFFMEGLENRHTDTYLENVINRIQKDSRQYAKRQCTFFRALKDVQWFDADDINSIKKLAEDFFIKK